ncbi:MAG: hypothetical protein ACKO34_06050 [Vampirovibrionales bacterium]
MMTFIQPFAGVPQALSNANYPWQSPVPATNTVNPLPPPPQFNIPMNLTLSGSVSGLPSFSTPTASAGTPLPPLPVLQPPSPPKPKKRRRRRRRGLFGKLFGGIGKVFKEVLLLAQKVLPMIPGVGTVASLGVKALSAVTSGGNPLQALTGIVGDKLGGLKVGGVNLGSLAC